MRTTKQSVASLLIPALALVVLTTAVPAAAVEVRIGEDTTVFSAKLARAYAQCVAPNDLARNGVAACSPPVTSACRFGFNGPLVVTQELDAPPLGHADYDSDTVGAPSVCRNTEYVLDAVTRVSGEFFDADTLPCPSGHCTFQEVPAHTVLSNDPQLLSISDLPPLIPPRPVFPLDANYEFQSMRITGPDDLPLATVALDPASDASVVWSNLTVPYEPCTIELGSACDLVPWTAACDFESGTITWQQTDTSSPPTAHVTLLDVAGSSPLCTTGTYQLETTVRSTVLGCGSVTANPQLCTLVDQTFMLPLVMSGGRKLDATAALPLGDLGSFGRYTSTEIVSTRLIDPTGQALAVPGSAGVQPLLKPQVLMDGDQIRLKATIAVGMPDATIDPTDLNGFTLTITDRNGLVYTVHIPRMLWQLQTPIGSAWTYEDPGGAIGGLRKVRIKRIGREGAVKGYKLDVRASGVDLSAADFPGVTIVVDVSAAVWRGNRTCIVKGPKRICK